MSYIARRPSRRLAGIVERVWRVVDPHPSDVAETICPDGCAELVIHLADPMRGQPRYLLVGQMDAPITVAPTGRVAMVGARLTPSGLFRLLAIPQWHVTGQIVPLDAVWKHWTIQTVERVASAGDAIGELDAFERALEQLLPRDVEQRGDRAIDAAVRSMRARGGPVEAGVFARAAGISRRQFERRFRDHVGLSPNLFGRIVRFQHAFESLAEEPGASLAARLGYADQAHLIREVRRFSGRTPTLLADAEGLTSFFANASARDVSQIYKPTGPADP